MKLSQILEKRSNPKINTGKQGHKQAVKMLLSISDTSNYGVSMTSIPKLGINPQSSFDTPVGIYFYPADYYLETKQNNDNLEFQDDAPYIQIFKITGDILYIDEMSDGEYTAGIKNLYNLIPTLSTTYKKSGDELQTGLRGIVADAPAEAKHSSMGGRFWYILYKLSSFLGEATIPKSKKKTDDDPYALTATPTRVSASTNVLIWNKLLRMCGYSAVIDMGSGIVHENEPTQGMVLDPRAIKHIATLDNVGNLQAEHVKSWEDVYNARTATFEWIRDVASVELPTTDSSTDRIRGRIMKYVMQVLEKYPKIFGQLSSRNKRKLIDLTDDKAVSDFFELHTALSEWTPVYQRFATSVENANPGQLEGILDKNTSTMSMLRQIRSSLSKFRTDKRAAKIIDTINWVFKHLGYY